jgi:drug/metabolite transporter (DMT)-like permease
VPALDSVFYRFAIAASLLLAGLAAAGRLPLPARRDQPFIAVQGLCLSCLNFICFYTAAPHLTSGLMSVIFSLATVFNAVNARLFFGDRITARTVLAAALGAGGLAALFAHDLLVEFNLDTLKGVGLAALGTLFFSLGNMLARRNAAAGITAPVANAWSMAYGAIMLLGLIGATGTPLVAPSGAAYLGALLYLAVFGSVIGFTIYLMLVVRLGSSRAAYTTVLFPVVALFISSLFEGYRWTALAALGLVLCLAGNAIMFLPARRAR